MKKLIAIALLALMLVPANVLADGGIWINPWSDHWEPVEESGQVAAINYQNGLEKLIISTSFEMKNMSEAVWIFPVPADPSKVVIDITSEFPRLYGYDVVEKAKEDVDNVVRASQLTQIYPIISYLFTPIYMATGGTLTAEFGKGLAGVPSVTVWEHIEKEGMTTELVTARSGDALYYYLENRGHRLPKGAISVLDEYVGRDYCFVVSWVSWISVLEPRYQEGYAPIYYRERHPGIFITFPTDKIYYPMIPTSIYGSKRIPIRVYILGYVTPELPDELKSYTTVNYYSQDYFDEWGLEEFYKSTDAKGYTKMEMYAPSKYFTDDLWFDLTAPPKVLYADTIHYTISKNWIVFEILFILIVSAITGALVGIIVFREWKNYALIGLANVFSIIGLSIAVAFAKTKKIDESVRRRLKQEGFMVITTDKRKFAFVILFSIAFLIVSLIAGYLLKSPLMI
jgi:hypothetical protein